MQNKIKVFENKQVRTLWNADEEEWYFSVAESRTVQNVARASGKRAA